MIKDKRLNGKGTYEFPDSRGNPNLVKKLDYTVNLPKISLDITFGDDKLTNFIYNGKEVKIKHLKIAERFKEMDMEYVAGLRDLIDSNLNRVLSLGIRKAKKSWILE